MAVDNRDADSRRCLSVHPDDELAEVAPLQHADEDALPEALGCQGWFTAKVSTLGELDAALAKAAEGDSACYVEVVGGRTDYPAGLAAAHHCRQALYADD